MGVQICLLLLACVFFAVEGHKRQFLDLKAGVPCYGLVYDGGSSSTKLNIFNWDCRTQFQIPDIYITSEIQTYTVQGGIANYGSNIAGIESYLKPIIDQGKESVPSELRKFTPVMFGATGGVRTLPTTQQKAITDEVARIIGGMGFLFNNTNGDWCRVIQGREEGAFLWLTVNYAKIKIKPGLLEPFETYTTIDLGGASSQITFVPRPPLNMSIEKTVTINLPNVNEYPLFSESYLGYGNDMARNTIIENYSDQWTDLIYENPCFFKGYVGKYDGNPQITIYGKGDVQLCIANIQQLLNNQNCGGDDAKHCGIGNSHYPTAPNFDIYALNGVAKAADSIGALDKDGQFTLNTFYSQLTAYAANTWSQIHNSNPNDSYLFTQFFLATYSYVLILNGYIISQDQAIYAPEKISSIAPTWALGMMMYELGNVDCISDSPDCQDHIIMTYE